jgi:hypothetical protein
VIYGGGDSAQTLLERLGNLFSTGKISKSLASIQKIYVITDNNLAARPRYKRICDLFDRSSGRESLVTIINNRVSDIEQSPDGKLNFYGRNRELILLPEKGPISADTAIAATGFRNNFRQVLEDYDRSLGGDGVLQTVNIGGFECGLRVTKDQTVLVAGVAAGNQIGRDQLRMLTTGAQQALSSVPDGNAVAIGFNTGATGELVRSFLSLYKYDDSNHSVSVPNVVNLRPTEADLLPGESRTILLSESVDDNDNNIDQGDVLSLLNAEFIQLFRNFASFTSSPEFANRTLILNSSFDFDLSFRNGQITINNLTEFPVSEILISIIKNTLEDRRVKSYLISSFNFFKYPRPLRLHMEFLNGKLNTESSFIQ